MNFHVRTSGWEFAAIGLRLNMLKTKILTTECQDRLLDMDVFGDLLEAVTNGQTPKYADQSLCENFGAEGNIVARLI